MLAKEFVGDHGHNTVPTSTSVEQKQDHVIA